MRLEMILGEVKELMKNSKEKKKGRKNVEKLWSFYRIRKRAIKTPTES
jgi:hypothetical protein